MKLNVNAALKHSAGRVALSAMMALPLATLAYGNDFYSACYDPVSGNSYVTDTYCSNAPYLCLQSADVLCTCNNYGNCWIQSWQCAAC